MNRCRKECQAIALLSLLHASTQGQAFMSSHLVLRFDQSSERFFSTFSIYHFISNLRENEAITLFQERHWPPEDHEAIHFKGFPYVKEREW